MRTLLADPNAPMVLAGVIKGAVKLIFGAGVVLTLIVVFVVFSLLRRR